MKTLFTKNLISVTTIVTTALLGVVFTNTGQVSNAARVVPPPKAPAAVVAPPVSNNPLMLNMTQLNQRVATVPALVSAKDGTPIVLSDDGSVTHTIWQGTYVFHPAGSIVQPGPMYLRWKDGIVTITPTPAKTSGQDLPGTLDASYVEQNLDKNGFPTFEYQTIRTLERDSSDPSVLRIPGKAWLFRVNSDGTYTTLVDAFVYQSGSKPVLNQRDADNNLPDPAGSQPVPVWVNANAG